MDDCLCSEIHNEPHSDFSYPGVDVVSFQSPLQKEATQTCSSLLHRLFLATHTSPLNFIRFPEHRPKPRFVREENGQASAAIWSAWAPTKLHSLYCNPCRWVSGGHPPAPHRRRSPSCTHMAGIEAMVQEVM